MSDERHGLPSASGADRLQNCPGSRALEAVAPKGEPTDEAMEGTLIAEALAAESDEGLDESGKTIMQRLSQMEKQAIDEWAFEKEIPPSKVEVIARDNRRFWIRDRDDMHLVASAKPDVVAARPPHALVINHKTGYIDVPQARGNLQSRMEALAIWHDVDDVVEVRAAIAQFRFRGKFSATDYDLAFLKRAEEELTFSIWRSEQPDAPRIPGYWCRYCRAKAFCPESAAFTMLPVVAMPQQTMAKKDIPAAVATLNLETLAFIRHKAAMIENVLDAVGKRLKRDFTPEQLASVGLKLQPSSGVRTLPDVQKTWASLFTFVTEEEFRGVCKVSLGAAKELLVKKLQGLDPELTQTAAEEKADGILEPAVVKAARDPSLKAI